MAVNARSDCFLEDISPLSQALVGDNSDIWAHTVSASDVYTTIENEKCFVSEFAEGPGNVGISFALDEIRGMETFCNFCLLVHDISDSMSASEIKKKFFLSSNDNIKVVWDYCILSKVEADSISEDLDEYDEL